MTNSIESASYGDVYFDVSDLLEYFRSFRVVSGIQRVTLQISMPALEAGSHAVALDRVSQTWCTVDRTALLALYRLAGVGVSNADPRWTGALDTLLRLQASTPERGFTSRSILVSAGANWTNGALFSSTRLLRSKGVTFVSFVHDTAPIQYPELCDRGTVVAFKRWFASCMRGSDLIVSVSQATAADVAEACVALNLRPPPVLVFPPHGIFVPSVEQGQTPIGLDVADAIAQPYVLFVGTLEPRKDHLFVLTCWATLIARLGDAAPRLVLVGRLGWRYEAVLDALDKDALQGKVTLITDASDDELVVLYDRCLFTVYNSLHEGWGLPVTESISRAKVPLVPRHSGLVESGADHAEFFETGSREDFVGKATRLITDAAYRASRTTACTGRDGLETWGGLVARFVASVAASSRNASNTIDTRPLLAPGKRYQFRVGAGSSSLCDYATSEAIRGPGWHGMEEWGSWSGAREVLLAARVDDDDLPTAGSTGRATKTHHLYLAVRVLSPETRLEFFVGGCRLTPDVSLGSGDTTVQIPIALDGGGFSLTIRQNPLVDLAERSGGADPRIVGIGVKALMVCRPSDLDARMSFLEYAVGYHAVGAG